MGEVILQGPVPQSPLGFCFVCAGACKFHVVQGEAGAKIRAHEASSSPQVLTVPVLGKPQPAVAFGVVPGTQIVAPLCWTHLSPIEVSASNLLRANGALPDPSGPVLLDGSRRDRRGG